MKTGHRGQTQPASPIISSLFGGNIRCVLAWWLYCWQGSITWSPFTRSATSHYGRSNGRTTPGREFCPALPRPTFLATPSYATAPKLLEHRLRDPQPDTIIPSTTPINTLKEKVRAFRSFLPPTGSPLCLICWFKYPRAFSDHRRFTLSGLN